MLSSSSNLARSDFQSVTYDITYSASRPPQHSFELSFSDRPSRRSAYRCASVGWRHAPRPTSASLLVGCSALVGAPRASLALLHPPIGSTSVFLAGSFAAEVQQSAISVHCLCARSPSCTPAGASFAPKVG